MLPVSFIRENREKVIEGLKTRKFYNIYLIDRILSLDKEKRKIQFKYNEYLAASNNLSKEIGKLFTNGKGTQSLRSQSLKLKSEIHELNKKLYQKSKLLKEALLKIPNIPYKLVSETNEILYNCHSSHLLNKKKLSHWELANKFHLIDWKLGATISQSGFPVYIGQGARLQRALVQYFLDQNIRAGYIEYALPYLVNESSVQGTGQLPDKEEQMYYITRDFLYLIPTGEIPLINCFRDQILQENKLPIKATTYTPCFRREAGSYGANVRGLNRLHQFDKVEIVQISTHDTSYDILEEMVKYVQGLLMNLNLPFRLLRLCGRDIGFTSSLTYDLEIYSYIQKRWLEVSSISNCTDFQTNRLNIRYKNNVGKILFCHAMNGSALALPRILAVLLEENQYEKEILIPNVLVSYTGFEKITLPF
ncbi:MAG: serine--tRNA ligase [Candidatus Walczuchella monophlebidarum]